MAKRTKKSDKHPLDGVEISLKIVAAQSKKSEDILVLQAILPPELTQNAPDIGLGPGAFWQWTIKAELCHAISVMPAPQPR